VLSSSCCFSWLGLRALRPLFLATEGIFELYKRVLQLL